MNIPKPIYESLPIIYLLSSLVCLIAVEAPFSLISAFLFAYASWMVWRMRKDYRQRTEMDEHVIGLDPE